MNIGQAAAQTNLAAKTIRYYEEIGLVTPARCEGNDYRDYSGVDIDHLRFLQRARAVGFSLDVCRELLDLYRNSDRRCFQVKALVMEKIQQIEKQMQELMSLKDALTNMANSCAGDDSTDCAIIESLAQPSEVQSIQVTHSFMPFTLVENQL